MARQVVYIDDIDGSEGAEEVAFSYRGKAYVIDLGPANRERMDKTFAEFIEHARNDGVMPAPGRRASVSGPTRKPTPNREHSQRVREWGRANGFDVADRGRIPEPLTEAFDKAHDRAPTKPPLPSAEQLAQRHAESQPKPPAPPALFSAPDSRQGAADLIQMDKDEEGGGSGGGNVTPELPADLDEDKPDEIEITKQALAEWLTEQGYNIDGMKYTARLKLFKNAHPNVKVTYIAEGKAA